MPGIAGRGGSYVGSAQQTNRSSRTAADKPQQTNRSRQTEAPDETSVE